MKEYRPVDISQRTQWSYKFFFNKKALGGWYVTIARLSLVFIVSGLSAFSRWNVLSPLTVPDVRINYTVSAVFHCGLPGGAAAVFQTHSCVDNCFISLWRKMKFQRIQTEKDVVQIKQKGYIQLTLSALTWFPSEDPSLASKVTDNYCQFQLQQNVKRMQIYSWSIQCIVLNTCGIFPPTSA